MAEWVQDGVTLLALFSPRAGTILTCTPPTPVSGLPQHIRDWLRTRGAA